MTITTIASALRPGRRTYRRADCGIQAVEKVVGFLLGVCEKHNRAQSQCFKCNPKLKDVFAAKYRAHYPGKEPPPFDDD